MVVERLSVQNVLWDFFSGGGCFEARDMSFFDDPELPISTWSQVVCKEIAGAASAVEASEVVT